VAVLKQKIAVIFLTAMMQDEDLFVKILYEFYWKILFG